MRRTHNAAGHRRIKQTAKLDANGFFAIDMPIPTRLAHFLPMKGVEEQKTTRSVRRMSFAAGLADSLIDTQPLPLIPMPSAHPDCA